MSATPLLSKDGFALYRCADLPSDTLVVACYWHERESAHGHESALANAVERWNRPETHRKDQVNVPMKTHFSYVGERGRAVVRVDALVSKPGPLFSKNGYSVWRVGDLPSVIKDVVAAAVVADDSVIVGLCTDMGAAMRANDLRARAWDNLDAAKNKEQVTPAQRLAWSKRLRDLQDAARHKERYAIVCEPIWLDD